MLCRIIVVKTHVCVFFLLLLLFLIVHLILGWLSGHHGMNLELLCSLCVYVGSPRKLRFLHTHMYKLLLFYSYYYYKLRHTNTCDFRAVWTSPTFRATWGASQDLGSIPNPATMTTKPHFWTDVLPVHKIGPDWAIHTFFPHVSLLPFFSLKWELLLGGSGQFYVGAGNKNQYLIICELSVSLHL